LDMGTTDMRVLVAVLFAGLIGLPTLALAASVDVEQPWARATPPGAPAGAVFMMLRNGGTENDKLVRASVPQSVAAKVELHTHIKDGDVMRMREVPAIDVPAGKTVMLEPGGFHVMLIGLTAPLSAGEQLPLTLTFAKAGTVSVTVPVVSPAAGEQKMPSGHGMAIPAK
jgi:copper(I)-binding protein